MTGQDFIDKLSEYFEGYGVGSLDVLSRMTKLGRKLSRASFPETRPKHALATHESLEVMEDAEEESVISQPEWGQKLVKQFFLFLASGEMDQCLAGFAPAAQAHLIDEVEAVQSLLEEFIAKHQPIEVTPVH